MHASLDEELWPNIYLLSIVGIWPMPSDSPIVCRLFAYFRIFVHFTSVYMLVFPILYTIHQTWGNVSILAECGSIMFMYILMIFKLTYVILRRRSCRRVHDQLKEFWEISHEPKERQSYEYFAGLAKTFTIACIIAGYGDIMMFLITPTIGDFMYRFTNNRTAMRRILPLDILYGFNYQQSPIFELLFAMQALGFFCSTVSVLGNDCTVMALILHITGQFRLISTRLKNIAVQSYLPKFERVNEKLVIVEIGRCILHHQRVIRLAEDVNKLIGPMVFGQILTSGLVVCLSGFSVIRSNTGITDILKFVVLFICIMMQLIMWCWPGELLIQESTAIARTILSEMPWYQFPSRLQRDLSFVILRAQKECKIVSFMQIMCLRKLTEIFNSAGSYMALLRNFQD